MRARRRKDDSQVWELHMFPNPPARVPTEADAVLLGSAASPEAVQWLRELSEPFLRVADEPIKAADFRPGVPARWLQHADGMRLALAFASAPHLGTAARRADFREGLAELPAEVVLYWFTMSFYGRRRYAARAAMRVLFTWTVP